VSQLEPKIVAEKYELLRQIGQGGMGAVYEARNLVTHKRCAVKVLQATEVDGDSELVKRFFREARASSVIESEHVVTVFDSGIDAVSRHPYMVMELLKGEDLEHVLKRNGNLDPVVAAAIAFQAASGLARAHELHIVHRDIKPGNLFLVERESGELSVKILDFGIAKVRMEALHESVGGLTRTGSLLGTPYYMSPEQGRGLSDVDARTDVWSLGVVLFEMLSGRVPFADAQTLGDLMVAIITNEPPFVQDLAPWVPPEIARIVHLSIARNVDVRFRDAGALRDALGAFLGRNTRITPDRLAPLSTDRRAERAARFSLAEQRVLRPSERPALATTAQEPSSGESPPQPRRRSRVAPLLIAGSVLVAGGAVLVVRGRSPAVEAAVPSMEPAPAPPRPSAEVVALGAIQSRRLAVPAGASVEIDGEARPVANGSVALDGLLGSTHTVVVRVGAERIERSVVISETGVVPDRIEAQSAAAPKAAAPAGKGSRAPAARPLAPGPAAPAKPAPKAGLNESTSEFD
jgi:serine/threonine-protein kinase